MKKITLLLGLALALAGGGSLAAWTHAKNAPPERAPSARGGVRGVLYAHPFTLERGYAFEWRSEHPLVDAGYVLVLEVDPRLALARQELEPVLFVGAEPAERLNHGGDSGREVVIVPAPRGADGEPALELAAAPMWFGAPDLPERIDAAAIAREEELASRDGVRPFAASAVASALQHGGAPAQFADRDELVRHAARVLSAWSPVDRELAEGMLAPSVK